MSWDDVARAVSADVLARAVETSKSLRRLGIPHAVIGGIAVGVHGYARATKDVDFLIGREGEDPSHAHGFSHEVAALYRQDEVDFLLIRHREPEAGVLLDELKQATADAEHIPVVSVRGLVWLKLSTPGPRRSHDLNDLRQLLAVGALDPASILDWLSMLDEDKYETFSELVQDIL